MRATCSALSRLSRLTRNTPGIIVASEPAKSGTSSQ